LSSRETVVESCALSHVGCCGRSPAASMPEDEDEPELVIAEPAEGAGPTHEPFSFNLLSTVQSQQSSNGLRHNDHLRYRQYCSRRLRRLYNVLKFKHGKGRYKQAPFPADFTDVRFLEVPLASAERAWSYGVQLKADNANAASVNAQWRHHSINRFGKAVKWAKFLEQVCKIHADQRTQMEAEAYTAYLEGVYLAEKEDWKEAHGKIVRCRKVCEYLSLASGPNESAFLKAKASELEPLLRECKYNLGLPVDDDDEDKKPAAASAPRDALGLRYRGQGLAIPSDRIKDKLFKCLEFVNDVKVTTEVQEGNAVIEKYGKISVEFGDVMKDIHGEMIKVGADGQTSEWKMLEAFARQHSLSMNLERNLVLLWNHLLKLEPLEDMSTTEARRSCKPEEGMRFCDMLKSDLEGLTEMPEPSEKISSLLTAYVAIVVNCRCLFLALCYTSFGKVLEGAALLDMLHARMDDASLGEGLDDPLGRLHPLFELIYEGMPTRVAKWRCRGLAQMCAGSKAKAKSLEVGGEQRPPGGAGSVQRPGGLADAKSFAAFPPSFRDIPCKPLLFDLAFPLIVQPDIEALLLQKRGKSDESQKGLLGKVAGGVGAVAGGLGSRLSGLWGGRK